MSKLIDLLKYASMWDVIPGAVRSFHPSKLNPKDGVDLIRLMWRASLTKQEITSLANIIAEAAASENYVLGVPKMITVLGLYETAKYLADRATVGVMNRLLGVKNGNEHANIYTPDST